MQDKCKTNTPGLRGYIVRLLRKLKKKELEALRETLCAGDESASCDCCRRPDATIQDRSSGLRLCKTCSKH